MGIRFLARDGSFLWIVLMDRQGMGIDQKVMWIRSVTWTVACRGGALWGLGGTGHGHEEWVEMSGDDCGR